MKASFVLALLAACVAGAAAQGTLAPTPPPGVATPPPPSSGSFDDLPDGSTPPVGYGGVPGLTYSGFVVVDTSLPANGAYAGTAESGTKVLTNVNGLPATLTAPAPFDIQGFYYANPNAGTGQTLVITCTPTGQTQTLTLAPDQGPTLVMPFNGCTQISFVSAVSATGRKLLQTAPVTPTSFTLDNLIVSVSAVVAAAPPPVVVPTAAPTVAPSASSPPPVTTPTAAPVSSPPPATVVARPPPSVLPTAVPTPRPPPGVTAAPTAVPTAAPTTTPTAAPTTTPTAAPSNFPDMCPVGQYRSQFGCARCVSRSSPFKQFSTVGTVCYPPTTLSRRSTVCTSAVLPAFIQSNINKKRTVRCINPRKSLVTLLLPIKNSNLPFLNSKSYIGASLRLNGVIARSGFSNGELVFSGFNRRLRFRFVDSNRTLLKKFGQTVQLTGTLRRGGNLLNYCFVAYLKVC